MVATLAALLFFLQAPDFTSDGMKALEEGKYSAAVEAFTNATTADPKDYFAHFNLGMAYTLMHKDAEGLAEYRKTLEIKPGLYEAELNAGILLMRQKNPAEALPLLDDAASQKPKEFRPRYYLAEAQLQTGAAEKADANFRLALEVNAKSAAAELGLAHALARQDKLADAAPHFRQAAQLDANYRDGLLELADLYEKNQQTAEAIAIYREFPADMAVQEHLGELLLRNKQYTEAIPGLEQAYQKDPTSANRVALAMAYLFASQLEKALPLMDQAVAADPGNYEVRMMYARALRDHKQYPAAAVQFAAAAKLKPGDVQTWNDLAGVLYLAQDYQHALEALENIRKLGQDTAGNWFLRAMMLDKLRQLKPALEAFQHFLALSQGKNPDQEFQARQKVRMIQTELERH
jgi:tetratricopeptide (TPR) repeat protein